MPSFSNYKKLYPLIFVLLSALLLASLSLLGQWNLFDLLGINHFSPFAPGSSVQNPSLGIEETPVLGEGIFRQEAILPITGSDSSLAVVPNYGVFELSLTASGDYPNPYLMMPDDNNTPGFVVGVFSGPMGETIEIDGFWDGGKTWKIRMAPISVGIWTYTTTSSDPGLDGKSGSFESKASTSKGFLRVDPDNPHHFEWEDGTPFYWAAVTTIISHFDHESRRDGRGGNRRVDDGTFQEWVETRAKQQFNMTHWGYYGFAKWLFNDKLQRNEGGPPFENYDPDRLNPAYHQWGDKRLEVLLSNGLIPQVILGWPDQNVESNIGFPRMKRYWRYLIARYSAYNIVFDLFGEIQEFSNYLRVAEDFGPLTKKWDPYDHLTSTHTVGDVDAVLIQMDWLDFIILQHGTRRTSEYVQYNKPVVNAEYRGYEFDQVNGEQLRPMVWDVRMRGGYFVYESHGSAADLESSGAKYASLANIFFRDHTEYWKLEYSPDLFSGNPGLANPGHEYVYYFPEGGSVSVDLTAVEGTLQANWYNPRSGEMQNGETVEGGTTVSFSTPDTKDWVLHLKDTVTSPCSASANVPRKFASHSLHAAVQHPLYLPMLVGDSEGSKPPDC